MGKPGKDALEAFVYLTSGLKDLAGKNQRRRTIDTIKWLDG
jgi:hypothetical protein